MVTTALSAVLERNRDVRMQRNVQSLQVVLFARPTRCRRTGSVERVEPEVFLIPNKRSAFLVLPARFWSQMGRHAKLAQLGRQTAMMALAAKHVRHKARTCFPWEVVVVATNVKLENSQMWTERTVTGAPPARTALRPALVNDVPQGLSLIHISEPTRPY